MSSAKPLPLVARSFFHCLARCKLLFLATAVEVLVAVMALDRQTEVPDSRALGQPLMEISLGVGDNQGAVQELAAAALAHPALAARLAGVTQTQLDNQG